MNQKKKYFFILLVISSMIIAGTADAQDSHFSQYANTPLAINPAMTGVFDGKFRLTNDYRSQWNGIVKGYNTFLLSADCPVLKGQMHNQYFGAGFMMYKDVAGEGSFANTILEGSMSFTSAVDEGADNFLSAGFQIGLNQQSYDGTNATWDRQWNGDIFDPTIPSYENIQLSQFTYLDMGAGLFYHFVPDAYNSFYLGGAVQHLNSAGVSFYVGQGEPLAKRVTFNTGGDVCLNGDNSVWFIPRALVMFQGPLQEILFGGTIKNKLQFRSRYTNYEKEIMYSMGLHYRWDDAIIISVGGQYNRLNFGFSYDLNLSDLSTNASGGSAFEISIGYIVPVHRGEISRNYNKMPRFF